MKELSIEEKARRYDEAIKSAKSKIKNDKDHVLYEDDVIEIFPELKESEDEKIRREIKAFIKSRGSQITQSKTDAWIAWLDKQVTSQVKTGIEWVNTIDDACDKRYSEEYAEGEYCHEQSFKWGFQEGVEWLEKQGEHRQDANYPKFNFNDVLALQCCMETFKKVQEDKELYEELNLLHGKVYDAYHVEKQGDKADKVEPKFKVGDWVVNNNGEPQFSQVIARSFPDSKIKRAENNLELFINTATLDKQYHLWSIEDAKDGDVLCLGCVIAIFKEYIGQEICICYCSFTEDAGFEVPVENGDDNIYGCIGTTPATKEQRDLLFQKMKEANYEWDADKKELKKL